MEKKDVYELTNPQKSIWLMEQFYKDTTVNNICASGMVYEEADIILIKKAINKVIEQNDAFRIRIVQKGEEVKQYISDYFEHDIEEVYVLNEEEARKIEKKEAVQKLDIIDCDLYKFKLAILENGNVDIILTANHMISDSWSMGIVIQEILKNYNSLKKGEEFAKDTFSYEEYINSENEYKHSEKFIKDKVYWNEIFQTIPEQVTIPSLKNNTSEITNKANRISFEINTKICNEINEYCKNTKITPFNFFMAIYSLYIGRVSNTDDFVIGTPILNRTNFREKNTIGMFINTAPVRVKNSENKTFTEYASNIATSMMGILRHQKYSYNNLLEDLREKNENIPNLYNIILSYQITRAFDEKLGNYNTRWTFNDYCGNDINIHIHDVNGTGKLVVEYDYLIDKYDDSDFEDLHNRIITIIKQVLNKKNIKTDEIEIITPEEKDKILNVFNATDVEYPKDKSIIDLFEEQVEKTPDNIAVVFKDEKLTYRELNEKANSLARELQKNGIQQEDIVAVFMNKSIEMIVAILAILKNGAAYLPIDIEYPSSRIDYMLKDSNTKIILSLEEINKDKVKPNYKIININLNSKLYVQNEKDNLKIKIKPNNLAYIMYTSGTTGNPKGVMIEHKNIIRLVKNQKYINFEPNDVIIQTGSIVFDACTFEIWGALLNSLQLFIISKESLLDINKFENELKKNNVTIMWLTAPLFNKICEERPTIFGTIKYLLTGGDVLSPKHIRIALEKNKTLKIINGYGPTENTTFSCCFSLDKIYDSSIPIGKPITNSKCYVVSRCGKLQPIGVPGELIVGGDGVSRGYLNRDELNEEKFILTEYSKDKVYKTGDYVRWLKDGNIEFIGRIDNQVKIRGFRIELNEINLKILENENVNQVYTTVIEKENVKYICTYVIFKKEKDVKLLRKFAKENLPQYMVPTYIIPVDKFPLNANGKINKLLLPKIEDNIEKTENKEIKMRNKVDEFLKNELERILKSDNVNIESSFWELGGDSLTAINLIATIQNKFNVSIDIKTILNAENIKEISDIISNNKGQNIIITKTDPKEYYELSAEQKMIFYSNQKIGKENIVYNIPGAILIDKLLEKEKVENIFNIIINNNSSFKTYFELVNGEPVQKILKEVKVKVSSYENTQEEIQQLINEFSKPFDLSAPPILRIELHYIDGKKTLMLFESHHIIMDGTSLKILFKLFSDIYNDKLSYKNKFEYIDYVEWQSKFIKTNKYTEIVKYWDEVLDDVQVLNFPYDYNMNQDYQGKNISKSISIKDFNRYKEKAKDMGVTPYMLFLTAFIITLKKYTGQNNICIGTPYSNRDKNEFKNVIGMFVNDLIINANIEDSMTINEVLENIKEDVLLGITNQPYPYEKISKKLNGRSLFDVMFMYQNTENDGILIDEKEIQIIPATNNISKFNFSFEIDPYTRKVNIEYCTSKLKKETMNNFYKHYTNILEKIIYNPEICVGDIPIVDKHEETILLNNFNDTEMSYPKDKTIIELFEENIKGRENKIALICKNQSITYEELNKKVTQLAQYMKKRGINSNDVVAILVNRGFEMIISMLAVLKIGGTYLPLDPTYPLKRINYILEDSQVKNILSFDDIISKTHLQSNYINVKLDNKEIYNDNNYNMEEINYNPESTAYLIYTSGSTGNPKGVMVSNKNVVNFVEAIKNKIELEDTIVSVTTYCFDIFVLESILPLLLGIKVVIADEEEQNIPEFLNKICIDNKVKMIQTTPSRMSLLLSDENNIDYLKNMRVIMLGGEPFPENLLFKLKKIVCAKIYNMYGPTETTVWSSVKDLTNTNIINIGKPIGNTQFYILNSSKNLLPKGIVGELYIGGDGVSKGYYNRNEITKSRFIQNPFSNKIEYIYNTGDLAKWNSNGEVICMGRSDFQVKIRGLRIELGEIERAIMKFGNIINAVVCLKKDNADREILCGYFSSNQRISIPELKMYIGKILPNYMVPTYLVQVIDFTYTPNGKIDRKVLPLPKMQSEHEIILPENETEERILKLYEKLLAISPISINDNFFEIGGDSILALKLQIALLDEKINITYSDIFKYNTVKQLALLVQSRKNEVNYYENDTYDFSKINERLQMNKVHKDDEFEKSLIGNVLLTGATGYLGSHILAYIMDKTDYDVYCAIRPDPSVGVVEKLSKRLNYYFGDEYDQLIGKRIHIVKADLTNERIGLSNKDEKILSENISCVINCAAIVKHYGYYSEFEKINVMPVKELINLCEKYDKKFVQISTISTSGNTLFNLKENINSFVKDVNFDETNLYINQSLENVYVRSKFEAEKIVLEHIIYHNLKGLILRIGNLTNRASDGKFQINANENAFINRVKSFREIGCLPEYLKNIYVEMSPVDNVAEAIVKSIEYAKPEMSVLHIYNYNHVLMTDLIKMSNQNFQIIDDEKFTQILLDNISKYMYLVNDIDENNKLVYESKIKIKCSNTKRFMEKIGFEWKKIDKEYIMKLLKNI